MIDPGQLLNEVIRPVLRDMGKFNPSYDREAAAILLHGTYLHESGRGRWIRQWPTGPGWGGYQMESATHRSIWDNYFRYRPNLAEHVLSWVPPRFVKKHAGGDAWVDDRALLDLHYSTVVARAFYFRVPDKLPAPDDFPALAKYWDDHWNKNPDKGTVSEWLNNYSYAML